MLAAVAIQHTSPHVFSSDTANEDASDLEAYSIETVREPSRKTIPPVFNLLVELCDEEKKIKNISFE
jgi:hypothetical protein